MTMKLPLPLILIATLCLVACANTSQYPKSNRVDESAIASLEIGRVLVAYTGGKHRSTNDGGSKINRELFKQLKDAGWDAVGYSGQDPKGFDLVLYPRIVLRAAKLSGARARWDGVSRQMIVNGKRSDSEDGDWHGSTRTLSLRLSGETPSGKKLFQTYGGITLLTHQDWDRNNSMKILLRDDLFMSQKELSQAVSLTLGPLLDATRTQ